MLKQNARSNCETPPTTTSCISRLDRERILIANKTNHHPYLFFPIWNVPNTENTLLWDQLTMLLGGKPGPLRICPTKRLTYENTCATTYQIHLLFWHMAFKPGWSRLDYSYPIHWAQKKKDSYKLPYQGFFPRARLGPVAASNHPQMCFPLVPGLQG